jgi:hypothetical protein
MSERHGLRIVGALILAVAVIFGCYLAKDFWDIYQGILNWHVKDSYLADVYVACRVLAAFLLAHWCYRTARTGYALLSNEIRRPPLVPHHQQNGPQKPNNHGAGQQHQQHQQNQNRPQQQQGVLRT